MKFVVKNLFVGFIVGTLAMGPAAFAVPTTDTVSTVIQLSGNVPTIFSLTSRGLPGDLDLTPNAYVFARTIGILHFKYNQDVDKIYLQTNSATGKPFNATQAAPVQTFTLGIKGACLTATLATTSIDNSSPGTNMATALAGGLVAGNGGAGVEEDCELAATWTGATALVPLAGKYSLTVTVTMIAK